MNGSLDWEPFHPTELPQILNGFDGPWWVAGGWALELFAEKPIREHADLDIEIPRDYLVELGRLLRSWDFRFAHAGTLEPWDGADPAPFHVNSLWCRPEARSPWRFQVMLATVRAGRWHYRRDPRISRSLADIGVVGPSGLQLLAPEIQLLYKARDTRGQDELDFEAVAGLLSPQQHAWLVAALELTHPKHIWIERLGRLRASG